MLTEIVSFLICCTGIPEPQNQIKVHDSFYMQKVHVGNMIKAVMEEQGRNVSWLAQKLHCHRSNVYKIYEKADLNSDIIFKVSQILQHDFFTDLSETLKQ